MSMTIEERQEATRQMLREWVAPENEAERARWRELINKISLYHLVDNDKEKRLDGKANTL